MINFKLEPMNFNKLGIEYNIVKIDNSNIYYFYELINNSIYNFNEEIKWDGMFDFNEAYDRIKNGMIMYVGIQNAAVFGHVWFKDYNDGKFLFNLFVKNKTNNKQYKGKEFISDIIDRFEYNKIIYSEVDDWNEKSIKLFKRLGFDVI